MLVQALKTSSVYFRVSSLCTCALWNGGPSHCWVFFLQEEAEVKSDGTHTTLKPSQLSVARITVVRGLVQSEVRGQSGAL